MGTCSNSHFSKIKHIDRISWELLDALTYEVRYLIVIERDNRGLLIDQLYHFLIVLIAQTVRCGTNRFVVELVEEGIRKVCIIRAIGTKIIGMKNAEKIFWIGVVG